MANVILKARHNYKIFGAEWDKQPTPTLTRTGSAKGLVANVGTDNNIVVNQFDSLPIWGEIKDVIDSYGNVFMEIPKTYIGKLDEVNKKGWYVSKARHRNFYLPWFFWDFVNNKELPCAYFGKYKGTSDGGGTPKLESKPDKYPLCNVSLPGFRTMALANNTGGRQGYQLYDIHAHDLITTLMFVEFATLNMQSVMFGFGNGYYEALHVALVAETGVNRIVVTNAQGATYRIGQTISIHVAAQSASPWNLPATYGRTITAIDTDTPAAGQTTITFDGATVNIALNDFVMNTGWRNGFSSAIAASSGSLVSNVDGKYPCVYRGIEDPYAGIWQFVDGININSNVTTPLHESWVCAAAADYASNVFAAPYEKLSYNNAIASAYVKEMGWDENHPYAAIPVVADHSGASASAYYCDYYFVSSSTGARSALVGGRWDIGAFAGPSGWSLSGTSANAGVNVGGRLLKKAL